MEPIPIIDLRDRSAATIKALDRACCRVGFVQIVGHRIPAAVEAAAWAAADEFFALDSDEKSRSAIPSGDAYGYVGLGGERLAASRAVDHVDDPGGAADGPADLKESFSIGPVHLSATSPGNDPAEQFVLSPTPWPVRLPSFRLAMEPYYRELAALADEVLTLMARALDLSADWFRPYTDRHPSALRLLRYPPVTSASDATHGPLRAGAHTDYGTITLLRQDSHIGGLQARTVDDDWIDVVPVDNAYVVNIGDAMARWTNDRWRSTLHRVVIPDDPAQRIAVRRSAAFFHNANWDADLSCIPTCLGVGESARYAPVTAGRHLMDKFRRAHTEGT